MNKNAFLREFNSLEHIGQNADELWAVVEELQRRAARSMIEIGVSRGGSMWIWNTILQQGPIVGIDTEDRIRSSNEPIFWRFTDNITYIVGDSHAPKVIAQVAHHLYDKSVDFLWIDGDHSFQGCKADFENYSRFVKPGGLIGIHDYNMPDVARFVDTLPDKRIINHGLGTVLVEK